MPDFRYDTFKTYLSAQWERLSPSSSRLPWLSCFLLHLTISAYGEIVLARVQRPYRKDDLIQPSVFMSLYSCSKIMERKITRILGWIAEGVFYTGTLFVMVAASHWINVTIIFVLYLMLLAMGLGLRNTILDWIKRQIAVRSYTTMLYDIHMR